MWKQTDFIAMKNNVDIFIGTHKPFVPSVKNSGVYKIMVGNHPMVWNLGLDIVECKHDEPLDDRFFSEIYMLKWVSENAELKDYVGFCHYRKYFSFMDDVPDMDKIFEECDAVVGKEIKFDVTNAEQYAKFHNIDDLEIIGEIIEDKYNDYYGVYKSFMKMKLMFPYNMFIMKKDDFIRYINFVKGVLDEYVKIVGTDIMKRIEDNKDKYLKNFSPNDNVDYQYRIGGYLAERLTNVFILTNFNKIKTYPVIITEDKYKTKK